MKLVNADIILSGKGITKTFLIDLIKNKAHESKETVALVLKDILGKTSA